MIRTGICQWCLPLQGPEGLSLPHDMGYEGVEMDFGLNPSMPDLRDETTRDAFLREKEKLRIEIPSLALNYLKLNDEAEIENTRKIIRQAVEVAVKLDARVLQLCSFWGGGMRNPNEYETTVDNLAYASQQANEYGIVVGSENQLTGAQNKKLAENVHMENFGIYFDTANPYVIDGQDAVSMLKEILPFICEVHIKDNIYRNRKEGICVPVGEGECHVLEQLDILLKGDYQKWLIVENQLDEIYLRQDLMTIKRAVQLSEDIYNPSKS